MTIDKFDEDGVLTPTEAEEETPVVASVVSEEMPALDGDAQEVPTPVVQDAEAEAVEKPAPRRRRRRSTAAAAEAPAEDPEAAPAAVQEASPAPARESRDTATLRSAARAIQEQSRESRQDEASAVARIISAMRNSYILYAEIAGVETEGGTVYWVCYEESVKIRIPFLHTFMELPAQLAEGTRPGVNLTERRRQFLTKGIGVNIPMIVTDVAWDGNGELVATASRTTALAKIRRRHFGTNAYEPVSAGMDVMATVISMGNYAAYVSACGVDVRVPNHDLSYRYIEDVSSMFRVGEQIRMRIKTLETPEGQIPRMTLSALPAEAAEIRRNLNRITPGSRWSATVISVRTDPRRNTAQNRGNGDVVVSLWLKNVDVPAYSRTLLGGLRETLHTGDTVIFEAVGITGDRAHGKIIQFVKRKSA